MEYPNNIFGIIDELLFQGRNSIALDVYYNEEGHPKKIHDEFGGSEAAKLAEVIKREIQDRNSPQRIWQVSGYGFGIEHSSTNCGEFILEYKGVKNNILKKTNAENLLIGLCGIKPLQ